MRFVFNPFTHKLDASELGPFGTAVESLTGNDSTVVPADGSFNINLLGENATGINITGNAVTSTLTVHGIASTTSQVGVTAYATNVQAAAQTATTVALTPSNITSLFTTTPLPSSQGGTGVSSPTAHTLPVAEGSSAFTFLGPLTNGQFLIGSTGADPVPATITAGPGIVVTNAAGSITVAASGAGFTWTDVTGTTQTIARENGYLSDNAGTVTFSLPASGTIGDVFKIVGVQGAWTISQAAGQQIKFGSAATTAGVTGSLSSTNAGDCVECVATNTSASTVWRVMSSIGNLTVA